MSDQSVSSPKIAVKRYRYFIGWMAATEYGQINYGGTDISRQEPIRGAGDVNAVTEMLRRHYGSPTLTVTAFSRYDD